MELDFTPRGYLIMAAIWFGAGCIGGILAYRQGRNVPLWFTLCLVAPIALFFLAGDHARLEARKDAAEKKTEDATEAVADDAAHDGGITRPSGSTSGDTTALPTNTKPEVAAPSTPSSGNSTPAASSKATRTDDTTGAPSPKDSAPPRD